MTTVLKTKKRVTHVRKAANSPEPTGYSSLSTCGHSLCKDRCVVRHVGPTSHMRDHHILHAGRGVAHVWTAVIIAGLAIVLTGAVAYSAANAQNQKIDDERSEQSTEAILNKIDGLQERIGELEAQAHSNGSQVTPEAVFPSNQKN